MNSKGVIATAIFSLGLAMSRAALATDLWLHIRVDDAGEGSKVMLNLPLSLLQASAPLLDGKELAGDSLQLDEHGLSVAELRKIWRQIENGPDAGYVTVEQPGGKVRIAKRGGYLVLEAADRTPAKGSRDTGRSRGAQAASQERVESRIPLSVVRALLSGSGDRFDLKAGLEALAREGGGELITVTGDHETVHMWIDHDAESAR